MSYCEYCKNLPAENVHRRYHDTMYGFPILDDNELFGRLILEINQAGLSWDTILKKEDNFRRAYANFNIEQVAKFTEEDRERLMQDAGIIRNRLKINAAIHNATVILAIKEEYSSFKYWLDAHAGKNKEEWTKLFKKTFKFTGGEIVNEFLMSCGYLKGAHTENCQIYTQTLKSSPKWLDY